MRTWAGLRSVGLQLLGKGCSKQRTLDTAVGRAAGAALVQFRAAAAVASSALPEHHRPGIGQDLQDGWQRSRFFEAENANASSKLLPDQIACKAKGKHVWDPLTQEQQQQVHELHREFGDLGFKQGFFVGLIAKRGVQLSTQQFRERFNTLQLITGAHSLEQQRNLRIKLWQYPSLLEVSAGQLLTNVQTLPKQLQQRLSVSTALVQRLIREHPVLLEQDADSIAGRVAAMGRRFGIQQHKDLLALWMRHFQLVTMSIRKLDVELDKLACITGLPLDDMGRVVALQPALLWQRDHTATTFLKSKPWPAVSALAKQLRELHVEPGLAWQLASKISNEQLRKPGAAAHIMQRATEYAGLLGVGLDAGLSLLLQGHLLSMPASAVTQRLELLLTVLQLQLADAQRLLLSTPELLRVSRVTLEQLPARFAALQQLLPDWSLSRLQAAIAQHGAVLLLPPLIIQQRWDLIQGYAGMHWPSAEHLQQVLTEPGGLRALTAPTERYRALQYVLEKQLQQQNASASGGMPLLWLVLTASADTFESMMSDQQPGFMDWCGQNPRRLSSDFSSSRSSCFDTDAGSAGA